MSITKKRSGNALDIMVEGRLDTISAPQLEEELRTSLEGVTELHFDLENLTYISSAGLRVLLSAQKIMNREGTMDVRNVSPTVMEIFDVTGFTDILTIR